MLERLSQLIHWHTRARLATVWWRTALETVTDADLSRQFRSKIQNLRPPRSSVSDESAKWDKKDKYAIDAIVTNVQRTKQEQYRTCTTSCRRYLTGSTRVPNLGWLKQEVCQLPTTYRRRPLNLLSNVSERHSNWPIRWRQHGNNQLTNYWRSSADHRLTT